MAQTELDHAYQVIRKLDADNKAKLLEWLKQEVETDVNEDANLPPPKGTLASLARWAATHHFASGQTDISERADEIMQEEFADYLMNRMNENDEQSSPD